jgi:hypothetical protein
VCGLRQIIRRQGVESQADSQVWQDRPEVSAKEVDHRLDCFLGVEEGAQQRLSINLIQGRPEKMPKGQRELIKEVCRTQPHRSRKKKVFK